MDEAVGTIARRIGRGGEPVVETRDPSIFKLHRGGKTQRVVGVLPGEV